MYDGRTTFTRQQDVSKDVSIYVSKTYYKIKYKYIYRQKKKKKKKKKRFSEAEAEAEKSYFAIRPSNDRGDSGSGNKRIKYFGFKAAYWIFVGKRRDDIALPLWYNCVVIKALTVF